MNAIAVQTLVTARNLVKLGWTRGAMAKDDKGNHVASDDPSACKWCSSGAIEAAGTTPTARHKAIGFLSQVLNGSSVIGYNDGRARSKQDVLNKFDLAIKLAKSK